MCCESEEGETEYHSVAYPHLNVELMSTLVKEMCVDKCIHILQHLSTQYLQELYLIYVF